MTHQHLDVAGDRDGTAGVADQLPFGVVERAAVDVGGVRLERARRVELLEQRAPAELADADMDAVTAQRPWGPNNPRWQLYAYGRLNDLLPNESIDSPYYVSVLVGDDPSETDAQPLEDGHAAGAGILVLRAESFGPRGVHMSVEMTVARPAAGQPGLRVLSWREVR